MDVIEAIYAAAREPERWEKTLRAIQKTAKARGIVVATIDSDKTVTVALSHNVPAAVLQAYEQKLTAQLAGLRERAEAAAVTVDASEEGAFKDLLEKHGLKHQHDYVLADQECGDVSLTLFWGPGDDKPDKAVAEQVAALRPHLERAFQISRRMVRGGIYQSAFWRLVDQSPHGVMAVDNGMRLLHANAEARRILEERDGLELRGQRLCATIPRCHAELHAMIKRVARGPSRWQRSSDVTVIIRRRANRHPIFLLVIPIVHADARFGCSTSPTFLFLRDLARELDASISTFSKAFDLTAAEQRLVKNLAAGLTLREHSAAEGKSEETTRWHLKNIFLKTHCSGQMQLLHLIRKASMPRLSALPI